jgi:tRNA A-37 threonylcarbamoyl transferase component Bud32
MSREGLLRDDRAGFRIWRQPSAAAEAALASLLPDPDHALARGEIRKPGSRAYGAVVELAGERYFLKRYNCRGRSYRWQYLLRRSRAVYTWQLARAFLERGVPVPVPLLCLEERRWRLLGRSYVLMEAAAGSCLREAWAALAPERRGEVLTAIGRRLGRMHRRGCLHGDLKWDNIMLAEGPGEPRFCLVDLDGGRLLPFPWRAPAQKDLRRFIQDLRRAEGEGTPLEALLRRAWMEGWETGGNDD